MTHDPAIIEAAARVLEDEINAFVSPKEVAKIAAASVLAAVTPLIRAAALERAALVAEAARWRVWRSEDDGFPLIQDAIAAAIRALKEQP